MAEGPLIGGTARVSVRSSRITQSILRGTQKASPPLLLPLLRSRPQAEVLTLVLLNPGQEWSLTSLASPRGRRFLGCSAGLPVRSRPASSAPALGQRPAGESCGLAAHGSLDRTSAALVRAAPSAGRRTPRRRGAPADQPRRPYRGTRRCHRPVRIQHPSASLVQQAPPRTQQLRIPEHGDPRPVGRRRQGRDPCRPRGKRRRRQNTGKRNPLPLVGDFCSGQASHEIAQRTDALTSPEGPRERSGGGARDANHAYSVFSVLHSA